MNMKKKIWVIIGIIALCVCLTPRALQNDTFYLIKLGDYLVNHGFDGFDHWTWVYQVGYTYPHFLLDIIAYLIYRSFGFMGIYIATMIFYAILGISIYYIVSRLIRNKWVATVVIFATIAMLADFVTMRGQLLSYSLFLWELYWLIRLYQNGEKRYILFLSLGSFLTAMVHGTFWLFTFVLYLPFFAEWLASKCKLTIVAKKLNIDNKFLCVRPKNIKRVFIALVSSVLVGFLTPTRVCFTYPFLTMLGNSQSYIGEHSPMTVLYFFEFCIAITIFLVSLIFAKTKIRFSYFCFICGLTLMSFLSVRHVALFYLIGFLMIGILLEDVIDSLDNNFKIAIASLMPKKIIKVGLGLVVVVIAGGTAYNNFQTDLLDKKYAPEDAVSYLKENFDVEKIHLFNHYNIGSYLLFSDVPVFIDSRSDLYQPAFSGNNLNVFDDYMKLIDNGDIELIDKYDITHILIYTGDWLAARLTGDSSYDELYRDDNMVLFGVKK